MTQYRSACQWFLNETRFQDWRTNCRSDLLYITASAGCGKTTIAAHVISSLQQHSTVNISQDQDQKEEKARKYLVLYFFFQKANFDDEGTATVALRSIISQLVHQRPDLYQLLRRQYDILTLKGHALWSWEPLLSVFRAMIQQIRDRTLTTTYIVLDGLDECSSDSRGKLLTYLNSLVEDQMVSTMNQSRSILKAFITGRPDEEVFNIIPCSKQFEIIDSHTAGDIDALVVAGVEQLGNRRYLAPKVQTAIKTFSILTLKACFYG
jgi:Cdc6-like AAA superfamily ATPase